jgi:hypothetical protein
LERFGGSGLERFGEGRERGMDEGFRRQKKGVEKR